MDTVKSAYITKELADLLGMTERSVQRRAARESWQSRPRPGRGGGNEWLLASMPPATRLAIARAVTEAHAKVLDAERRKQSVNALEKLPASRRERVEARAIVVNLARQFVRMSSLPVTTAYEVFCADYNRGKISVPDKVRTVLRHICRKSLQNWQKAIAAEGVAALAEKRGQHRRGTGSMDQPYVQDYVLAHIYRKPQAGATHIYRDLKARLELENRPETLPEQRTVQRWYKTWRQTHDELFVYISNPDQWRSKFRVAFGDAAGLVDRLNQEWEMDSTPSDLLLADGKRHTIVACIDLYSRRVTFHVSRTSSSHAVATCLGKAINAWGVPEIVRTDNGQDYVSRHIDRVLLDMDILHDVCAPFSPEEKPFVERVFKSFLYDTMEMLTGFTGHNVSERKALEARKSFARRMMDKDETVELRLTPEELQIICDRWANDTYAHRVHRRLKTTPYQQANAYDGEVYRVPNPEAMRLLFLPCADGDGTRVVSKDGGIKIFNDEYLAPELALHSRRRVQVRVDDDERRFVHVYTLDGNEFICTARGRKNANLSIEDQKAIANSAKQLQKSALSEAAAKMRKASKGMNIDNAPWERMKADELRARKIEAEQPLRAEITGVHMTPPLDAAAQAAVQPDYTPSPVTDAELAARKETEALLRKAREEQKKAAAPQESSRDRFLRASQIRTDTAAGKDVPEEDTRWLAAYETTAEYDAERLMQEFYGQYYPQAACG